MLNRDGMDDVNLFGRVEAEEQLLQGACRGFAVCLQPDGTAQKDGNLLAATHGEILSWIQIQEQHVAHNSTRRRLSDDLRAIGALKLNGSGAGKFHSWEGADATRTGGH